MDRMDRKLYRFEERLTCESFSGLTISAIITTP
jgi:hypothetical protein